MRYLSELVDSGARLHGASDPSFGRIHVLREAEGPSAQGSPASRSAADW